MELRTKGLREGLSGISEIGPRYKSTGKHTKRDDDLSNERSFSSKMELVARSPSSTSIEHKYVNGSSVRENLGIEESGQRKFIDMRGFSAFEDTLSRGLKPEKPLLDKISQEGRASQGSASLVPPSPFRPGLDRPFMDSIGVDVRDNSNPQYKRNHDPGFGRGHGNSWRGVPNWTLSIPNIFAPFQHFQHGSTHVGFQAMAPQFPSEALFSVRPPMQVNHAGIPYHIPGLDRFSGHIRPFGWQNVIGTLPSHFHGWNGNNCVFRDNSHVYGSSDWDWNRHLSNSSGLDCGPGTSKDQNGHLKKDSIPPSCKDASVPFQVDEGSTEPASYIFQDDCNWDDVHEKTPRTKLSGFESLGKVPMSYSPTIMPEKMSGMLTPSDNTSFLGQNYLSKLDISAELALPELYDQCMCLLDVEKNASIDSDASTGFLKNGSRLRQKYAATLSPFPADSSLFQRAMEHYKKQRVELPKWGKVHVNLATNRQQVDEPVPASTLENMQVAVSTDDALANLPISTAHLNKEETLSPPSKENLEELHQSLFQMGQDHARAHPVKLVMSGSSGDEYQEEYLAAGSDKKDEFTSGRVTQHSCH